MNLTTNYIISGADETRPPQAYGLTVTVTSAVDMPSKVFVFQRKAETNTDLLANDQADSFISLADPVDLAQYPEDEPDIEYGIPYYRKDTVALLFRSMEELDELKELLDADIADLVRTLQLLEGAGVVEEVVYG